MKWWFKLWDKVMELLSSEEHNAGSIGYRTNAIVAWYLVLGLAVFVTGVCFKWPFIAAALFVLTVGSSLGFISWKK